MKVLRGITISALCIGCALATVAVARADYGDDILQGGAWHFKSIPCVETTVINVTPRLASVGQTSFTAADFEQSGVSVAFDTRLGYGTLFPSAHAGVTHYQDMDQNSIMMAERPGDRVQVCFLGTPLPTWFPDGRPHCNPDKDPRGRMYRVFDYRQNAAYSGGNSEHTCGGA